MSTQNTYMEEESGASVEAQQERKNDSIFEISLSRRHIG